jgi:photosystem II stability/assembly factor-like uncharacterized protein
MRPILIALLTSAALAVPGRAADLRYFEDAPLRAVQFVDANEGWAIGDEGVIWHTIDGGKHWERQPTGVRASLRSVHFLNPFTGWVVGREALPHGAGSVGVVLVTQDGGLKWRHVNVNLLPGLNQVRFFNDKVGVLLGDGTDQFPTGVFTTTDGGRSWKPVQGPRCPSWLAADFQDAQTGALAGSWSRLATLRDGVLGAADVEERLGGRSLNGLQIVGQRAVAVGEGGLVLLSNNSAGLRWGFADLKLPAEITSSCDFHAVHCRGEKIWVVGRPGSVVFHSPDHGKSWQLQSTEQPLPLNGVFFLDEQTGWAVGEFGTVLGTSDGGKSWAVQRQGGQRAAVLFLHARAEGLPLDGMAALGAEDGYLTTAVQVACADPASAAPGRATEQQTLQRAVRQAGGAAGETLWQFPLPEHLESIGKAELLQAWNRLHADRAADQMLRELVLTLRIWQPEVVVTDPPDGPAAQNPADALVAEAVREAVKRAEDPEAFPEQLLRLGLKPCRPAKLYARTAERSGAPVVIDLTEARLRLQATIRDFAAPAAGLLAEAPVTLPTQRCFRLLASRLEGAANHHDLMQGITLAEGGAARRKLEPLPEASPEVEKAIATRRNLQALTEAPVQGLTDPDRMLAQLGPMLAGLPDDQAAAAALRVANHLAQAGQWTLAREAFLLMADRFPAHPLTADAYRWLVRYNSSSEARRRQDLGQFIVVSQGTRGVPRPAGEAKTPINGVETVGNRQIALLTSSEEARKWYQGSLEIEPRLAAFGPLVATDPAMQFCFQAARRNLGDFEEARHWYTHFLVDHPTGPWHDAAAAELWLNNRSGTPPKPVVNCRLASERPFLDGNFDDACWHGLKPIVLRDAVGKTLKEYSTEAWMAYDKDFLYLALRCQHPPEHYVAPVKVRQRDADLRPYDRVSLLLDLDRDYNTCFQLQIDQRGCLCEDCWGDRSWNPHWFVAVRSESTCWQIEAAIPLIELTGDSITPGRAWACNLVRVLPGRGVQALSLPADVQPRPEGMGLLLFTAEPQHPPAGSPRLSAN